LVSWASGLTGGVPHLWEFVCNPTCHLHSTTKFWVWTTYPLLCAIVCSRISWAVYLLISSFTGPSFRIPRNSLTQKFLHLSVSQTAKSFWSFIIQYYSIPPKHFLTQVTLWFKRVCVESVVKETQCFWKPLVIDITLYLNTNYHPPTEKSQFTEQRLCKYVLWSFHECVKIFNQCMGPREKTAISWNSLGIDYGLLV
jgi:hypothetical protein